MCGWLDEEPRQIQQAQARLEQATGKPASRQTAHRIVKKSVSLEAVPTAG
ncbi:MAG: hypothetical protein IPL51_18085 [Candidatus Competibacteraceae bacterium]|nr:hypothetical protein [Candidatus Competibacteraceae bacterium]MBK8509991.1 hypothetical protein [Candidatus Competibacteraceae bacterium]MBK8510475.1 hypothetical protein [Candidatus Competibacteraceae bacterium]